MNKSEAHTHHKRTKYSLIAKSLIGVLSASILVVLGYYFFNLRQDLYTDDAQIQQLLIPVNARVSGYIQKVSFKDFQQVKKGDTLVIIDNSDYLVQKELAEAALMDAKAGRQVTATNIHTVENGVTISEAKIGEIKARLWNAQKNYNRYAILLQKESVTQQQFDQVKSDYEALKAQLETLERSRTGSDLTVQEASSKIEVNMAAIKRAEAQLKLAELNLKYTVITAPENGFLGRKSISEGQLVQPGQQLINIIANDNKWVTANFKEKQLASIKQGDRARLTVDGLPDVVLWGKVQAFASATGSIYSMVPVDNATGNFVKIQQRIPVRIEFDANTNRQVLEQLKAGMNVIVNIEKEK